MIMTADGMSYIKMAPEKVPTASMSPEKLRSHHSDPSRFSVTNGQPGIRQILLNPLESS
jgi:hypothetical protein